MPLDTLSIHEARQIALAAQGFGRHHASRRDDASRVGQARIAKEIDRLGALQIDSVNVFVRAHYMPLFSRLGPYPTDELDHLSYRKRHLFEYWGHQASLLPLSLYPHLRHRMRAHLDSADDPGYRGRYARWAQENSALVDAVRGEIVDRGPIGVSDLEDPGKRNGPWWGWSKGKSALEWLFLIGDIAVAQRRNWERIYDLTDRVIPEHARNGSSLTAQEATEELLLRAADALGIGTADDIGHYFQQRPTVGRSAIRVLIDEGRLREVRVEGWERKAVVPATSKRSRPVDARAIVSPFDSLMWHRERVKRLFDFDYKIEIYVPAPKRTYGYYVMPFLLGDTLVGRLDLKADRATKTLLVPAAHVEPGAPKHTFDAMASELRLAARWLDLDAVKVTNRGNAGARLRAAIKTSP